MKNKILLTLCLILILLPVTKAKATERTKAVPVDAIIEYEMAKAATTDLQGFVDNGLVPYAGVSPTEWIISILAQTNPELDFSNYLNAVQKYIFDNEEKMLATDFERIAYAYLSLGENSEWITKVIDEYTGKRGIMSIIYGLMLASHGDFNTSISVNDITNELLKFQLQDGGFAVTGTKGDIDVTAMAIQAMAPLYQEYREEIDNAIAFLKNNQLENGGFTSYGVENVESADQALMAYCELGMKNEADILVDYILTYQREDGSFSHLPGDSDNAIATYQSWQAIVCYNSTFYDIKNANDTNPAKVKGITGKQIKSIILAVIAGSYIIVMLAFVFTKRMKKNRAIIATAVAVAFGVFIFFAKIETKSEHKENVPIGTVSTTIEIIGHDGIILEEQTVMVREQDTAFLQLEYALTTNEIVMDYTGSELFSNVYIKSIDGLSEFDYGKMSGWTYTINGEYPNVGCSQIKLNNGDRVVWIYKDGD